jgi:hypothetical protein
MRVIVRITRSLPDWAILLLALAVATFLTYLAFRDH